MEIYLEGDFAEGLSGRISATLSRRWAGTWNVKVPPRPSIQHPAERRVVVPLLEGTTAETLHHQMAADVLALEASHSFHFRTRWSFQESPNHQEVYEERGSPRGT